MATSTNPVLAGIITASPTTPYPHCVPMFPINSVASPVATRTASGRPVGKLVFRRQTRHASQGPTTRTVTSSLLQMAHVNSQSLRPRMQALAAL